MNRISPSGLNQLRIRHLRLVETLVQAGSLHKAAKALHVSQPAASAMLKEVEDALGATLFDRTRRGVALNAHGSVAMARMRTILGELSTLSQELRAAGSSSVLRFGTLTHAFYGVLQRVLHEFLVRSDCRIDLRVASAGELLDHLQQNQLDCMLGRIPAASMDSLVKREFFFQPLYLLETCVLASTAHPLSGKRRVTLRDLSGYPWILQQEGANSRHALMSAFAAAGLPAPRIRMETSSFAFSIQLLAVGDYLAVAPRDAGSSQQRLGLARILPVKLPNLSTPVAFIAPRTAMLNPNVRLLWESIRKTIAAPARSLADDDLPTAYAEGWKPG